MMSFTRKRTIQYACFFLVTLSVPLCQSSAFAATKSSAQTDKRQRVDAVSMAEKVDQLLEAELKKANITPAPLANDEDFLRRVTFDLAGRKPGTSEVILFGLDASPGKRQAVIDELLQSEEYGVNWARYWRDVIYLRATDARSRLNQNDFEEWMTAQLNQNKSWDQITTDLLTASGDVRENGNTALIFAHQGDPAELAAETSRIFLGIQIQCANCHDHPTDKWKRNSFHELAAFFPRVRVRQVRDSTPRTFEVVSMNRGTDSNQYAQRMKMLQDPTMLFRFYDKNRDGKLTEQEVQRTRMARGFEQMVSRADKDGDKALTAEEIKSIPVPENRQRFMTEYHMPDLNDPTSMGKVVQPVLFVGTKAPEGLDDMERRETLSKFLTTPSNIWFSRAIVNRLWAEMLGEGFYTPIDDIGPERSAVYPEVLDALSEGFTASGYDLKWLCKSITNTRAYQREMQKKTEQQHTPFAAQSPTRLRGDQIFTAITQVFGVDDLQANRNFGSRRYQGSRSARGQFSTLFTYDPSTSQDEITGDVPQALFMMNSKTLNQMLGTDGNTKLAQIARDFKDNNDAIQELYLLTLSRVPSKAELKICQDYIQEAGNRNDALEDLMWSLLNSSEFITKR